MCGIAGIIQFNGSSPDRDVLRRMAQAMAHRGPDDEGFFEDRGVGLAFRRLSIIDLSGGHQPMTSDDGRFTVAFNGEIYNFQELRHNLEKDHGAQFRTHSDTEVILAAYRIWGTDAFTRFNGMFALALWDAKEQKLLLARDRLGKKPLYYARIAGGLCFGSEAKVLFEHPKVERRVDRRQIPAFVTYRYVPGAETLFEGIECLAPASFLEISAKEGIGSPRSYWDYDFVEPTNPATLSELEGEFKELLDDAVRLRRIADVPVGVFLSGGLDSSIIAGLMAEKHTEPLKTFSVGFDTGVSEVAHARRVAQIFGTDHHETIFGSEDLISRIPAVLHARETPITNTSDIPIHGLAELAQTKVKVVLSGEGADEILAGYPKYVFEHYLGHWLRVLPAGLLRAAANALPFSRRRIQLALECSAQPDRLERHAAWFGGSAQAERELLLTPELRGMDGIHAFSESALRGKTLPSQVAEMLYLDTCHWLPANLLLRGDRMTMANSLELRCPFLDYRLVEFAAQKVPQSMKIRGFAGKWLLKHLAKANLPPEIINRKKWGFQVPTAEWFRGPLANVLRDVLLSSAADSRGYFDKGHIHRTIDSHVSGRANHDKQLWSLLQLELWHLMFVDGTLDATDKLVS